MVFSMDMSLSIATLATAMSQVQLGVDAGMAIAGKVLDTQQAEAAGLMEMLETSVPSFGHSLDIRV